MSCSRIFANFSATTDGAGNELSRVMDSTGTSVSDNIKLLQVDKVAVQVVWTGNPTGAFILEASCDEGAGDTNALADITHPIVNWSEISNSSVSCSGAAGNTMYNISDAGYKWLRVSYTNVSGTGAFGVRVNTKM